MYNALLLILIVIGFYFIINGVKERGMGRIILGIFIFIFTISFFWFLTFWGEKLWFDSINYPQTFWTFFFAKVGSSFFGIIASLVILVPLTFRTGRIDKAMHWLVLGLGCLFGASWGYMYWEKFLIFMNAVSTEISDPILDKDTGFYMFILPYIEKLLFLLIFVSGASLVVLLLVFARGRIEFTSGKIIFIKQSGYSPEKLQNAIYVSVFLLLLFLSVDKFLDRYNLMYSNWGVVSGPGWTDVHARLPAYLIASVFTLLTGIVVLIPGLRKRIISRFNPDAGRELRSTLNVTALAVLAFWFISLTAIPMLLQWLRVEPNEITFEKKYIANNIRFTKIAFGLDKAEEREFSVGTKFNKSIVDQNPGTFKNIRLWDWRALDALYRQFQEIRLYYQFNDVDIDRYTFNNEYRQVMVSAREMNVNNLPSQSQTFINKRFKYTHGNGITMTTVSEFTPEGLPNLLIKDIPPSSVYHELEVKQPGIYYGEFDNNAVVVNSLEKEFDFPKGDENVYVHYEGTGGIPLSSLWRKFIYGWRFDGTKFFLSSYTTKESRLMFDRKITTRAKKLAPFLEFDEDPYVVLSEGKLYWIIDAYTTSKYFPYSEPFRAVEKIEYRDDEKTNFIRKNEIAHLNGINYIRNSVKVVVDAYNGNIDFYSFDKSDAILQVWKKIIPGMFLESEEMPTDLMNHIRYPFDLLLLQGLVYSKYHMNDPEVFYNQEDLWVRATEKYYGGIEPVEPYYVMWQQPDSERPDFVLMLPFTPKNKQVMIGWIAGMCDGKNYGRFLAYMFPKEKRILGPQQVETKIDQDRFLSGQLTLWDQRGSRVIRGNVLAIPVDETIIYVEPIYLQSETAAYPELRLVAVMHGDQLSYAETFDKALAGLYGGIPQREDLNKPLSPPSEPGYLNEARNAFDDYLKHTGNHDFEKASEALAKLHEILNRSNTQKKN